MGFSRQEYWSWMPCPPSGDPPDPEIELVFLVSPALAGSLPVVPPGKPNTSCSLISITKMRTITSTHISYLAVHVCTQACVCAHRRVCILHYLLSLSHFHMCVHIIYCQVMTFIYLAVLSLSCSMWDLVPWPGIEPGAPALRVWSLSHWTTREVLSNDVLSSQSGRISGRSKIRNLGLATGPNEMLFLFPSDDSKSLVVMRSVSLCLQDQCF